MVSGPLIFLLDPEQVNVTHLSFVFKYSYQSLKKYIYISGGRLNKKDGLTRYGDSHVKDKTS